MRPVKQAVPDRFPSGRRLGQLAPCSPREPVRMTTFPPRGSLPGLLQPASSSLPLGLLTPLVKAIPPLGIERFTLLIALVEPVTALGIE